MAGIFRSMTSENIYRYIPISALFAILGVIFPVLFHFTGLGSTFLPMFLPVVMASTLMPPPFAVSVAVITPLVSYLFTGMPPIYPPILLLVILELLLISFLTSYLYFLKRKSIYLTLVIVMTADRLVLYLFVMLFAGYLGFPPNFYSAVAVLHGIPGIILIFVVVPLSLQFLKKNYPQILPEKKVME
jgi:hypothetical protein